MRKRAFGYARVSSEQQKESGLGIEAQTLFIRQFYQNRFTNEYDLQRIFTDEAESASKINFPERTQGKELYMLAGAGDLIIINRLDRIFRNMRDQANTMHHFNQVGVRIVSPEFGMLGIYDSNDHSAWLLLNMMTMNAEMAARSYSARMVDFREMCKQTGRAAGGEIPLGFLIARDAKGDAWYQPDPVEREIMSRMTRWYRDDRYTLEEIAVFLNDNNVRTRKRVSRKGADAWTKQQVWDWINAHDILRDIERDARKNLGPGLFVMPNGMIYKVRDDLIPQSKLVTKKERRVYVSA